jgi:hypothetical protein
MFRFYQKKTTISHQKTGMLSTQRKYNSWIFFIGKIIKNVRAKTKTKFTINCSSIKLVLKNSKKNGSNNNKPTILSCSLLFVVALYVSEDRH